MTHKQKKLLLTFTNKNLSRREVEFFLSLSIRSETAQVAFQRTRQTWSHLQRPKKLIKKCKLCKLIYLKSSKDLLAWRKFGGTVCLYLYGDCSFSYVYFWMVLYILFSILPFFDILPQTRWSQQSLPTPPAKPHANRWCTNQKNGPLYISSYKYWIESIFITYRTIKSIVYYYVNNRGPAWRLSRVYAAIQYDYYDDIKDEQCDTFSNKVLLISKKINLVFSLFFCLEP